jgi:hypothetical protein
LEQTGRKPSLRGVLRDCHGYKAERRLKKMVFNFKKIASVASSGLMMMTTVALAAAANYPAPFVQSGNADVAIVVGESAAFTDSSAATVLSTDLATTFAAQGGSAGATTTTTGEVFPLFTSSTGLWMNSSINTARNTLTDDDLPTVLAEGDFSGNVDADITQTIVLNGQNRILFGQEPTSEDDPTVYLDIGTSAGTGLYNATVLFDNTINFTNAESQGETMMLFGKEWTVGADTTFTELVLYKSSEKVLLSLGGSTPTPSRTVEVDGDTYTVELVSGSDSDATIRVTDSSGRSESREIDEDQSRKVNGIEIAVTSVDESEALGAITAEITVASDKVLLSDGQEVRYGADEDSIDGTLVEFGPTTSSTQNMTQLTIQVFADDSDVDAVVSGSSFLDPVFGSFKIDFAGLNVPMDSEERDPIKVSYTGNDQLDLEFTDHRGNTKKFQWYDNSSTVRLAHGTSSDEVINVFEFAQLNTSEYVVIGNEDEGFLLELQTVSNATSGYNNDRVTFKDVFSGDTKDATITGEGVGTIDYGGRQYALTYTDNTVSAARTVRLNYPESSGNAIVVFPTIESDKGALVSLYAPLTINLSANAAAHGQSSAITGLVFPDGDEYATTLGATPDAAGSVVLTGLASTTLNTSTGFAATQVTVGTLTYNISATANSSTVTVQLMQPGSITTAITTPAVVIWEEEEDTNDLENALVVIAEGAGSDSDGNGVSSVRSTSGLNGVATYTELESNDDLSQLMTIFGSVVQIDQSESDQKTAEIWYPDEQVMAQVYAAEGEASISGDGSALGNIVVTDNQVSTVGSKNLIVIGGSCINKVAARLLTGSDTAVCGADFTTRTGVGTGSYLIQSFESPWASSQVAVLVAGYTADDTTNAATALRTQKPDVAEGKKYTGSTATSFTPVTA